MNDALLDAIQTFADLPIQALRYREYPTGTVQVEVEFATCRTYRHAAAMSGAKVDAGRLLAGPDRRVFDAISRDGVVLSHHCWPHLDCWGLGL